MFGVIYFQAVVVNFNVFGDAIPFKRTEARRERTDITTNWRDA